MSNAKEGELNEIEPERRIEEENRNKLNRMIQDVMDNDRPIREDEEILKQSQKVDVLLNRLLKQRDRGKSR